jgi:hypothetical protein
MSTSTPGATIRYTLDGSEPTSASTQYTGSLSVGETVTVKARAFKTGWTASDSGYASYWISAGVVAAPALTPGGGSFESPPYVSIDTTTGNATIRYTTDGTEPTPSSALYRHPFLVMASTTIKARAFKAGMTASAATSVTYELDAAGAAAAPTIVPAGGRFVTTQTVMVTGPSGATLRYTTNGLDPGESDAEVPSNGEVVVDRAQILKVRAWASGLAPSAVRRADFIVTGQIASAQQHSVAVTTSGSLYTWGSNQSGALGDGGYSSRSTPYLVLTNVKSAAAGRWFTVAVRTDGTVWSWGANGYGQLGDGTTWSRNSPGQVSGLTNVVAVAAGEEHVLAVKDDGSVWAWGYNADGQLGDGTTTNRITPVRVPGISGVTQVAAGANHSLALQTDGGDGSMLWAWGGNTHGQVGDGTTLSRLSPVQVPGLGSPRMVSASRWFSLAQLTDGSVWAWGVNTEGQLGQGSLASSATAVRIPGLSRIRSIAAGTAHGIAIDVFGSAWGGGHTASASSPPPARPPRAPSGCPSVFTAWLR